MADSNLDQLWQGWPRIDEAMRGELRTPNLEEWKRLHLCEFPIAE